MNSIWTETAQIPAFPSLEGDIKTDVLVIGGGMAGLLCAYFLREAGAECMLVEGGRVGGGVTKNTTAKITSQHGLLYQKLLKGAGAEKAGLYLEANQRAIREFKALSSDIDCGFEEKDAFIYSLRDRQAIENEVAALHAIDYHATLEESTPLPFNIAGAVRFPRQAQFHPVKFMAGIAKGLHIYENTFVQELAPRTAITREGKIKAEHMIVASHFPFLNKHGGYWLKMNQHRSYAIALENAPDVNGMYLDEAEGGLSFRNAGGMLIVGGGGHKTGKQGGNWGAIREFTQRAYPNAQEKCAWAAQDCMTLDGVPYIGRYGRSAEGMWVATGFNKWGMTSSMVSAMLLTDLILGRKNEWAEVFSPQRSSCKPQLFINGLSAVGNLLTPTAPRCPHMGCALKWNRAERSWDCPCHGSRFGEDGALLDNPVTGNLK